MPDSQRKPIHTQSCGLNLGVMNLPPPLVHIDLYEDGLQIRYPLGGPLQLSYSDITSVKVEKQLVFHGVKIEHSNHNVDKNLFVWSGNAVELHQMIQSKLGGSAT